MVAERVFPPGNTALIAELIRRDLPHYETTLSPEFVSAMNAFARRVGLLDADVAYEGIVAKPARARNLVRFGPLQPLRIACVCL